MKKFFSTLLVLIILAALGLFFGWAQLGVPPDAYGLISSKTHGLDTILVKPGEFRWIWYKLIPTNVKTIVFRLNPIHHDFAAHNTLPSAKVYSAFAGIDEDFSWDIRASFTFFLRPEALITLAAVNNISAQEELARYENNLAGQIEAYILRRIDSLEELLEHEDSPELVREIQEQFPLIAQFSLIVKSAQFPDFSLYKQTKNLYEDYIALQKGYIAADMQEQAKNRVESLRRFGELEQYGALLTKYPILLEYMALEGTIGR